MASASSGATLVVSGATGWLGQEVLALFDGDDRIGTEVDIIPIASKRREMELTSGKKLITQTFEDLILPKKVEGFIDLAFLTREKVSKIGFEKFVLENLKLISHACQVIELAKPKWVVLVSSGAIFKSKTIEFETDITENPYGFLKRVEELLIADAVAKIGANIVIGRLWGATGRRMPKNRAYAVSDFLCQAMEGVEIQINSRQQVFRRYCDAGEFMSVLIGLAESGETLTLDSGGPLIEMGSLATEVATHFPDVLVHRGSMISDQIDDYYPRSDEYEKMAGKMNVQLSSISEQISRTVEGHLLQFHS